MKRLKTCPERHFRRCRLHGVLSGRRCPPDHVSLKSPVRPVCRPGPDAPAFRPPPRVHYSQLRPHRREFGVALLQPALQIGRLPAVRRRRGAGASGTSPAIPASADRIADRSTTARARGVPACASRRGVCELSRVRMRRKATRASTPSPGAHTQPSTRTSRGSAPRGHAIGRVLDSRLAE